MTNRERAESLSRIVGPSLSVDTLVVYFDAATKAAEERMREWQPISTAPKDGTMVLLGYYYEWGGGGGPVVAFWHSMKNAWCDGKALLVPESETFGPTHWMPLPEPPRAIEK